jgi:hypothetical protein
MNPFDENRTVHSTWPVILAMYNIRTWLCHYFSMYSPKTEKHVVVSAKQKIVGVENMEDNYEDVNQFEEMPPFASPMNIKHIEKEFDKKLMPYMRKGGNEKFV